jgi:hypothetical protein
MHWTDWKFIQIFERKTWHRRREDINKINFKELVGKVRNGI